MRHSVFLVPLFCMACDLTSSVGPEPILAEPPQPIAEPERPILSEATPHDVSAPHPSETVQGCLYTEGQIPSIPAFPTDDCSREYRDTDGVIVERGARTIEWVDGVKRNILTLSSPKNVAKQRFSEFSGAHGTVFVAVEALHMEPTATLPNTYGMPATWSETSEYNSDGVLVRKLTDLAMDGMIDTEQAWVVDSDGGILEYRLFVDGELYQLDHYGSHGRLLWTGNTQGSGTRFEYDPQNRLVLEEQLESHHVIARKMWIEDAPTVPLQCVYTVVRPDGIEEFASEQRWYYFPDGGLQAVELDRVVYGHLRKERREFNAMGQETLLVEHTEALQCGEYKQISEYFEGTDILVRQITTCDGKKFSSVFATVSDEARLLHQVSTFYGSSKGPTTHTATWEYDECGAVVRTTRQFADYPMEIAHFTWDSEGRLLQEQIERHGGAPETTTWAYDEAGRVIEGGGSRYSYDQWGRLVAISSELNVMQWPHEDPGATSVQFSYDCLPD